MATTNNERVSQLVQLLASEIQTNDVFLVTDISQHESKQLQVGQLLQYIESSGSFNAFHATLADTASFVEAINIAGIVAEASLSTQSLSASNASFAISASFASDALTASYSNFCVTSTNFANTSSYLTYSGFPNGTASYAINSGLSATATTALNLFYNGTANGTASFAITASNAIIAARAITSSLAITASYASLAQVAVSAVASISSSYATTSSFSLISNTSSYVTQTTRGPFFINPVVIASSTNIVPWQIYDATPYVPGGTQVIILDSFASNGSTNSPGFVEISPTSASVVGGIYYLLMGYRTAGSGDACTFAGQGSFPLNTSSSFFTGSLISTSSFWFTFTQPSDGGCTLRIIGYY
jgi:hypothetical protein